MPHDRACCGENPWQTGAMTASFVCRTESPLPVERLFDLARSIDEHVESQRTAGERAVGGVTSGLIGEGQEVTWRARHFAVPLTMTSRITHLEFPRSFTDEQVKGPFKVFRHIHEFEQTPTGSTMVDRVEFTAPLGVLGRAVERLFLARYLERLIIRRGRFLAEGRIPGNS
ncbi:ligand-binding SRPBCC domain-containing protein [Arthrobacter ulcerisalmonis]|nr:ligand-binding SRPBCC domain-containing protein [Arthrobacter ulcerisalmonis]